MLHRRRLPRKKTNCTSLGLRSAISNQTETAPSFVPTFVKDLRVSRRIDEQTRCAWPSGHWLAQPAREKQKRKRNTQSFTFLVSRKAQSFSARKQAAVQPLIVISIEASRCNEWRIALHEHNSAGARASHARRLIYPAPAMTTTGSAGRSSRSERTCPCLGRVGKETSRHRGEWGLRPRH